MRRSTPGSLGLVLPVILALGCGGEGAPPPADDKPLVVASIFPVGDLTREMAADLARVEVLLPPGASPATFDVTPRQLMDLHDADLFIMIGGGLDEWLADVPEASGGSATVLRLSDGLHLLASGSEAHEEEESHEGHEHEATGNPHIWLDPILVRDEILPKIQEGLSSVIPEGRTDFAQEAARLADSLTFLDTEIRRALEPLERRSFVVTHPAWSYFALQYGLEEVGVIHTHPGQEPSSREMAVLLAAAREHQIECLFVEPQIGEVAARALAVELDLPTCLVDPLGGPAVEGRRGYFQLLRFNTEQFVQGLGGEGS